MSTLQQAPQPVQMNAAAPAITAAQTTPVNNITSPSYPIASLYRKNDQI